MTAPTGEPLFMVWGPPSHGPRSKVLARELGIDVHFVDVTSRRGFWVAAYKYAAQAVRTAALLWRRRPRLVFVQSPPSPAVVAAAVYGAVTGAGYVVDAHSDAMLSPWWTRPRWMHRLLARRAVVTLVTNDHFARRLESYGGRAMVLADVPTTFTVGDEPELEDAFHLLVVNTFAADEPLAEILEAARRSPGTVFHVTGRVDRHPGAVPPDTPDNVRFTGFLPDDDYFALMQRADAVMCLTTRDHTMQRGACEALSLRRPIVTSDWPLLRSYFERGTVHVDNTAHGIAAGVDEVRRHHDRHLDEIRSLSADRRREWEVVRDHLADLVGASGTSQPSVPLPPREVE